jgi:hypothetical protein
MNKFDKVYAEANLSMNAGKHVKITNKDNIEVKKYRGKKRLFVNDRLFYMAYPDVHPDRIEKGQLVTIEADYDRGKMVDKYYDIDTVYGWYERD